MVEGRSPRFEPCSFPITVEARYLLHSPDPFPVNPLLVIATHGYGMNPEEMLELVLPAVGDHRVVAALQGPNQHFLSTNPGERLVGYNWGTPGHWKTVVRTHHDMVLEVLEQCSSRFSIPRDRTLLLGFSQPVGLNYRLAATYPDRFRGLIGICGGIPRDWEAPSYHAVSAALLHLARDQDEYYPTDVVATFADRLRLRAADVEFHLLPGAHRFPSNAAAFVRPWINRVFAQ